MFACRLLLLGLAVLGSPLLAAQETWEVLDAGTTADLYAVSFPTSEIGYVAGDAGTVRVTLDGGTSWVDVSIAGGPDLRGIHFFDIITGVAVGAGGRIYRTTDGGVFWTEIPSGTVESLVSVAFDGNVGVAGGTSQTILRSDDAGLTWTVVQDGFFGGGFYGADVLGNAVFVAGDNSIFQPLVGRSTDGGATFDFAAFYLDNNEGRLSGIGAIDADAVFAVGRTFDDQGAIARSDDGGATWTTLFVPEALNAIASETSGLSSLDALVVGDDGSIYRKYVGSDEWELEVSTTSSDLKGVGLAFSRAYAVGAGGTVLGRTVDVLPSIGEGPLTEALALTATGPNPFRSTTTLRYTTPDGGPVDLRLYDALGREVAVLGQGGKPAGTHTATIDGTRLSPGVYVCVLRIRSAVATRSLVRLP